MFGVSLFYVVHTLCGLFPWRASQNWPHYDVTAEALTGDGMRQMYMLGRDTRSRYTRAPSSASTSEACAAADDGSDTRILSPVHDYKEVFIRSSDSPRCMQSAAAFGAPSVSCCSLFCAIISLLTSPSLVPFVFATAGLGLFPDGFGPTGFLPSRPTLVPIHAQKEEDDDLLDSRKAHCRKRVKADSKIWLAHVGLMMMESNRHAIQSMSCLCGYDLASLMMHHHESWKLHNATTPVPPPAFAAFAASCPPAHPTLNQTELDDDDDDDGIPDLEHAHLKFFQEHESEYKGELSTAIKDIADALIFDRLQGYRTSFFVLPLSPSGLDSRLFDHHIDTRTCLI
jgi:hypothetical protein